ncbi:MAG: DUF2608 domain-containing protein [Chlamydiales bacterium]|nr:DUF2608 domain-containing protein [Chlamydiales bacterium]
MFKKTIALLLLLVLTLNAEIIETPHFKELKNFTSQDTLLVLDIDDTLLITKQMLGCDEWFTRRVVDLTHAGLPHKAAMAKAIGEWEGIRQLTQMELVEAGTESIIHQLQAQGFKIMGLTTQGLALSTCTIGHLREVDIDLARTAPAEHDHYFLNGLGVLYHKGILFTSGTPKGAALVRLLDHIGYKPSAVVFINDKASHLKDLQSHLEERGIKFIGLRYSYSDARKAAYCHKIAHIQFNHSNFGRILTDAEAAGIFDKKGQ